jgi:murein DD-endopeptidase MepM/ murein hydrolase activator NlpD
MTSYVSTHLSRRLIALMAMALLQFNQAAIAEDDVVDRCTDRLVKVEAVQDHDGVQFLVTTERITEATICFECSELINLRPSHPLPYTFALDHPAVREELLRLTPIDPKLPWHYTWKDRYERGLVSNLKTVDFIYSLPYLHSEQHTVAQTYFGKFSHQAGTKSAYAVDFRMPEGTTICAARPGVVIAVRSDSNMGGPNRQYERCGNYVVIKHGDGTYAEYWHLKKDGVLVSLGQKVKMGTHIGLSGATGFVNGAHLHFDVMRIKDGLSHQSLPFRVRTQSGVLSKLEAEHSY